ncbi:MAG: HD domain-containing protein [Halobacteriovoraceae bacterium]|jgi:putative nucleotidyltransferase with HDIG domain|nr:HD domain-containing protein [Halobacteriovoraceae bacterium]MBT5092825.1 HD domain-containing protein [Halobacteriovoraceae bacterium]
MYQSIYLEKISASGVLPADIYIKISDRYLKYKEKGQELETKKIETFLKGGMKVVYFEEAEIPTVKDWLGANADKIIDEVVASAGGKFKETAKKSLKSKDGLIEALGAEEMSDDHFSNLEKNSSGFISEAVANPMTGKAINALLDGAAGIAAHSLNVANLSIFLAMKLGVKDKKVLDSIYLGAIMHDFGKIRNKSEVLNSYEVNNIPDDHPDKGLAVVKKSAGLDPLVLEIIAQHHEQFDGDGYPKGIKGDAIKFESQIVALANFFDQNLRLTAGTKEDIHNMIKSVAQGNSTLFAPKLFPAVTEALKDAFK